MPWGSGQVHVEMWQWPGQTVPPAIRHVQSQINNGMGSAGAVMLLTKRRHQVTIGCQGADGRDLIVSHETTVALHIGAQKRGEFTRDILLFHRAPKRRLSLKQHCLPVASTVKVLLMDAASLRMSRSRIYSGKYIAKKRRSQEEITNDL